MYPSELDETRKWQRILHAVHGTHTAKKHLMAISEQLVGIQVLAQ